MEHYINDLMRVSLENIKDMIDVNTIVGEPIKGLDSSIVIIPISRVKMAFASGGTDFKNIRENSNFGGGAGGSVSINPIAFVVINNSEVKLMHIEENTHILERLIDKFPEALEQVKSLINNFRKSNSQSN